MDTSMDCGELLERFDRLERANIRLRIVALSLGMALVLLAVVSVGIWRPNAAVGAKCPAVTKVLRVERLELVDPHGRTMAVLGIDKNGDAALALLSKNGGKKLTLNPWTLQPRTGLSYIPYSSPRVWRNPGKYNPKLEAWIIPLHNRREMR
jgi:hypothetical protein